MFIGYDTTRLSFLTACKKNTAASFQVVDCFPALHASKLQKSGFLQNAGFERASWHTGGMGSSQFLTEIDFSCLYRWNYIILVIRGTGFIIKLTRPNDIFIMKRTFCRIFGVQNLVVFGFQGGSTTPRR